MGSNSLDALLEPVLGIARQASRRILEFYDHVSSTKVTIKADKSPVTEADTASQDIIEAGLRALTPDIPVLGEETANKVSYDERRGWGCYWLVDPLDGTKEFLGRTGEFCINIALIEGHRPILGVLYIPVTGVSYCAALGIGAFKRSGATTRPIAIHTRPQGAVGERLRVLASRLHSDKHLRELFVEPDAIDIVFTGSAIKFGLIAEGAADIYPRLGPTSEWDTAAGQCIVEEAGGSVVDLQFNPLQYNTQASLLNPSFLVLGDKNRDWRGLVDVTR